jgi:nucleotide-binding universal stress UspA family protein
MTDPATSSQPGSEVEDLHFRNLLVAVDGSSSSWLALRAALTVAHRDAAVMTLVAVAPDVAQQIARWGGPVGYVPESQEDLDGIARDILDEAVRRLPQDISVRMLARRGNVATEILGAADEGDYDAIVLGARGVGKVGALLGSVSHEILHRARIPVFVAHEPSAQD